MSFDVMHFSESQITEYIGPDELIISTSSDLLVDYVFEEQMMPCFVCLIIFYFVEIQPALKEKVPV
jgi:hypothetical protein